MGQDQTNVERYNGDKAYDFLIKSLNLKNNTTDKINDALLKHYHDCHGLFQEMYNHMLSLTPHNITECMSKLHSLKGHVRNIGFFRLGMVYHKLESVCGYILEKHEENSQLFDESLEKVSSIIKDLLDTAYFLHQSYMDGEYNPNLLSFQKNKSDNWRNRNNHHENILNVREKTVSNTIERLMQNRMSTQELKSTTKRIHSEITDLKHMIENKNLDSATMQLYVNRLLYNLEKHANVLDKNLNKQEQNANNVINNLLKIRLMSISHYCEAFYETVHLASVDQNKKCQLEIIGEHIQVDKTIMDSLSFAISHILRNSVVHGIEDELTRRQNNKPPIGKIVIEFNEVSNFLTVSIKDDGAGIHIDKIQNIVKRKLPNLNTQNYTEHDWYQFIFHAGITTREHIDEFAGRGVGLESVKNTLMDLNGEVVVHSEKGHGAEFIINMPMNQFIYNLILVRNNDKLYAIPEYLIDTIVLVNQDYYKTYIQDKESVDLNHLLECYTGISFNMKEYERIPSVHLSKLINEPQYKNNSDKHTVIVLTYLNSKAVLLVNDTHWQTEAIVENVGALQNTNGVLGAITVNKKDTALVINPILLMNNFNKELNASSLSKPQQNKKPNYVLIVDDSKVACLTTQNSLKKMMIQSISKEDGQVAYDYLCANLDYLPDVILTDFEMPKMNGMELSKKIAANNDLKHIPIIMITSKSLQTYKQEAQQVGIKKLLAKPFVESELQDLLKQFSK